VKSLILNKFFPVSIDTAHRTIFAFFAGLVLLCLFLGIVLGNWLVWCVPFGMLIAYLTVVDMRFVFYILLACLPLSTEFEFNNGLATDLPTEPLIVGLMFAYVLYVLKNGNTLKSNFIRHPISLLLLAHFAWIIIASFFSSLPIFSIKFTLAKFWYIVVFYFFAGSILKDAKDIQKMVWTIFVPLLFTVILITIRHAMINFSFKEVNSVMLPFYRNHVNYASVCVLFVPFATLGLVNQAKYSTRWWVFFIGIILLIAAIQFSYTRAAYAGLGIAFVMYFVIRAKLMRHAILAAMIVIGSLVMYLVQKNHYLLYTPNFERAISHKNFDNLLEATFKMEDISTVERVYRWIAGVRMVAQKPIVGFGPNNFYNFYKSYTVRSFETYVSYNPEHSTVHCYYLLVMIEQGVIGCLIFLAMCFYVLIKGEQIYHATTDKLHRQIIMTALLSTIIIHSILLINDMIETDKVGSFFFMCMAILVNMDLARKSKDEKSEVKIE
jgi:O-antigen ligase